MLSCLPFSRGDDIILVYYSKWMIIMSSFQNKGRCYNTLDLDNEFQSNLLIYKVSTYQIQPLDHSGNQFDSCSKGEPSLITVNFLNPRKNLSFQAWRWSVKDRAKCTYILTLTSLNSWIGLANTYSGQCPYPFVATSARFNKCCFTESNWSVRIKLVYVTGGYRYCNGNHQIFIISF